MLLMGSWCPDQGLNQCPLQWKGRVLATGQPGNSPKCTLIFVFFYYTLTYVDLEFYPTIIFCLEINHVLDSGSWGKKKNDGA